jgi:hypothetical protein
MVTQKFVQIVGNIVTRGLRRRYPTLMIRFFAGQDGDMMRVYIANHVDVGKTGRLYDVVPYPKLETLKVKELAKEIECKVEAHIEGFLGSRTDVQQPDPETAH